MKLTRYLSLFLVNYFFQKPSKDRLGSAAAAALRASHFCSKVACIYLDYSLNTLLLENRIEWLIYRVL